jgi:hypothetical protein
MKTKTIGQVHRQVGEAATPTHVYNESMRKIYDVETHRHTQKVLDDMGAGRPIWIPKKINAARNGQRRTK